MNDQRPLQSALRVLLALGGAFGLLGLVGEATRIHYAIQSWLEAYQAVMRPLVGFLFGWIAAAFGTDFPDQLKDYVIVGLFTAGGIFRYYWYYHRPVVLSKGIYTSVIAFFAWPVFFIYYAYTLTWTDDVEERHAVSVALSSFVYFVLLILGNVLLDTLSKIF
jgi:hypothetical protein